MKPFVIVERRGDVAVLRVDNAPVNALSPGVPEAIITAIDEAVRDRSVAAIVVMGAGRTFIAGADIATLEQAAWGDRSAAAELHDLLAQIEDCTTPVVMAVHGTALGGGLELAMAGHARVASADALLGQPEVNLGIIPGAEGTQRLPRLVGVERALDMCVTGKPVKAADALAYGLVDEVVAGDLADSAVDFARRLASGARRPRTRDRNDRLGTPAANGSLFAAARDLARTKRRHQFAPMKVVDAVEAAATMTFEDGCRRERELFFECVQNDQAKALIHVFFAERAAAKPPTAVAPRPVDLVAIVGAGTMGGGIAMACANAGLRVLLKDTSQDALDAGLAAVRRNYAASVARGSLTDDLVQARLARIDTAVDFSRFGEADLIVEAVYESLELKRFVFHQLDAVAKPGCVLATNTSTLDIDAIANASSRSSSVVGLHFFSPAHVMRLVEVVRGEATSDETIATAFSVAKRLGKAPVLVGNCRGFVGNRMMFPYMYEAQFLVEEGATPEQVDRALTDFGMAMGIFAVDDMAGIDVAVRVRRELGHFSEPGVRRPLVQEQLVDRGRLGQKTGKGWYRYDGRRKAGPDEDVVSLIRQTAADAGIPQRTFTHEEIVERTIYALINEGARIIDEGYASRAADVDVIYVNGYGFPGWRGGPLFYADRLGIRRVYDRVCDFHREFGDRWKPAPLLASLASSGGTFRERDRSL